MAEKDFALRALAIIAYLIAFLFSLMSENFTEMLALIWGVASLGYWVLAHYFEERDREWAKADKE